MVAVPINDNSMPPPCDLDAEAAVISACMLDPKGRALDETRTFIQPADFYSDANRFIFSAICELADAGNVFDAVTVISRLRDQHLDKRVGGSVYLMQLIDATPYVLHVNEHAQIVRDKARLRRVIATCHEIRAEAYGDHGASGTQSFLQRAEQRVSDITHLRADRHLRPIADVMRELNAQVSQAKNNNGLVGVPTGFHDLDKITGGLRNGNLRVIAARPSMGKTAVMVCEARKIASDGYATALFSLEMPAIQIGMRLVVMESELDMQQLATAKMDREEWSLFTEAVDRVSKWPIFIDDTPAISIFEMRSRVKRLKGEIEAKQHPNVTRGVIGYVGIDYLQLMAPARKTQSRQEDVSSISRDLKESAKSLDVPLTVLSQLNREVEKTADKRPQLWHLRDSGAVEQDADEVILLYRAEYYLKEDTPPADKNMAEFILAKHRNGRTDKVRVVFDAKRMQFTSLSGEKTDDWRDFDA